MTSKPSSKSASTQTKNKKQNKIRINKKVARAMYARRRRAIPVAYSMRASAHAEIRVSDTSASLTSVEIFPISRQTTGCSFMLPMSPTKWSGTRTAVLASTYDSFRPLSCSVSWEPAVPTSTSGSVALGTVFAGCRLPTDDSWNNLSSSLAATNGGFVATVWDHASSRISLQKNLRANLFPLYNIEPDDIPFWICVASNASIDQPLGYLIVKTKFTLRNPAVPGTAPPVSGSGEFTFSVNEGKTTLAVAKSVVNKVLNVGQDILFTFARRLLNTSGQPMSSILDSVLGHLSAVTDNLYQFSVDNTIGAQTALGYIVGTSTNF